MSVQRLTNGELLNRERAYRVAYRAAGLSFFGHGIVGILTGGAGLVSWVGSVPKLCYNFVLAAKLKKERISRGLERPKTRARDFLKLVGKTAMSFLHMDFDLEIPNIDEMAAVYNTELPTPQDDEVDAAAQAMESVLDNLSQNVTTQAVARYLKNAIGHGEQPSALQAEFVGEALGGLVNARLAQMPEFTGLWTCNICSMGISGVRFNCMGCSKVKGRCFDVCSKCLAGSECLRLSHTFDAFMMGSGNIANVRRQAGCDRVGCGAIVDQYRTCSSATCLHNAQGGWDICDDCYDKNYSKHSHKLARVNMWALGARCDLCYAPHGSHEPYYTCMTCSLFSEYGFSLCISCFHTTNGICQNHVFMHSGGANIQRCTKCWTGIKTGALYSYENRNVICSGCVLRDKSARRIHYVLNE